MRDAPQAPPRRSVFVLDDDRQILEFIGGIIRQEGLEPSLFMSRDEMMPWLESAPPDLVILDLRMPDASGHQVLREIRSRHPKLPIIMATSSERQEDAVEALRRQADDFLRKPFQPHELVAAIRRVLGGK